MSETRDAATSGGALRFPPNSFSITPVQAGRATRPAPDRLRAATPILRAQNPTRTERAHVTNALQVPWLRQTASTTAVRCKDDGPALALRRARRSPWRGRSSFCDQLPSCACVLHRNLRRDPGDAQGKARAASCHEDEGDGRTVRSQRADSHVAVNVDKTLVRHKCRRGSHEPLGCRVRAGPRGMPAR